MSGWIPCARVRSSSSVLVAVSRAAEKSAVDRDVAGTRGNSLAAPQLEREGEQELLRAIVQVPLETTSFRLASLDDPSARCTQLIHPASPLQLKALVLDREPGLWPEVLEEQVCRYRIAVVDHDGDWTTSTDQFRALTCSVRFHEGQSVAADVADVVRPVAHAQIRISDRPTQDRFDRMRIVLCAEQAGDFGQITSNRQAVPVTRRTATATATQAPDWMREHHGDVRRSRRGGADEAQDGSA